MFLSVIKDFSVKRILINNLHKVKRSTNAQSVKTIGLIVDQSSFLETEKLIDVIVKNGFSSDALSVIVFNGKKGTPDNFPTIKQADLKWNGELNGIVANEFLNKDFDLLISYYVQDNALLLATTFHSKASLKVGFAAIDERFNDLIIKCEPSDHAVFIQEVFKYLKILNKI